jgi:heptosyltransferase-1
VKIALVRLSSLGDIVLCMASLQVIKQAFPDCKITWVTDQRFADLLDCQPDVEQVIALDLKGIKKRPSWSGLVAQFQSLRSTGPFDRVIDLHGMIKSAVVGSLLGGRQAGFAKSCRKESLAGLWYREAYSIPYELPATVRYHLLVCKSLGIACSPAEAAAYPLCPYMHWQKCDEAALEAYLSDQTKNVLIVPGTSAPNKNYPPEQFAAVANQLKQNLLVCHGNDAEYAAAMKIAGLAPHVRVLPRLTLGQLKALAGCMNLVIGGDSGPTHLALASGVPSITLFGATPVCFTPSQRNRVIKTATMPNLLKPDPHDFSVADIPVGQIAELAVELLSEG